jgi:glutathione S-transferase
LNTNLIGDKNAYLCGDQITLCDYFGIELVLIGELVGSEYEAYPNIKRWMNNMKQLKNWTQVHAAFDGFAASLKGKTLIRI